MRQTVVEEREEALRTYLQDHVAGAQHAVQLLEALNELQMKRDTEASAPTI